MSRDRGVHRSARKLRRCCGGAQSQGRPDQDPRPVQVAQSEHAAAEQRGPARRSGQSRHLRPHQLVCAGTLRPYALSFDGAPWRGTGNIVDPAHAIRVPKGTFMQETAGKVHWDGTKDEGGAYFIVETGPAKSTDVPKENGPWAGGDPSASIIVPPDQIPWKKERANQRALLAGDPSKPGMYVMLAKWPKGNTFSHPHFHTNDRYVYVLEGTWWVATGNKFDPANLMVPVKAGTFVTEFGKEVHWAGAKDEDATIMIFGEGPTKNTPVDEAK